MLIAGFDPHLGTLAFAGSLGYHGFRKGSLSASGGLAAATVGYAHLAAPHPAIGILLLTFYFTGSRATKVNAVRKAQLETEVSSSDREISDPHKSATGGRRDAYQVLCNSLLREYLCASSRTAFLFQGVWVSDKYLMSIAAVVAVAYRVLLSPEPAFASSSIGSPTSWLLSSSTKTASVVSGVLLFLATGHYACCMGDTLASELGILSSSPPRLITDLSRIAPPGTNGGVSRWGTVCSAAGGAAIGLTLVMVETLRIGWYSHLLLEELFSAQAFARGATLVGLSTLAGLGGSLIDSILGATLQRTWFRAGKGSQAQGRVLVGRLSPHLDPKQKEQWSVITGKDILSNNAVNLVSSSLTAGIFAVAGYVMLY